MPASFPVAAVMFFSVICLAARPPATCTDSPIKQISNDDVSWTGNPFGLEPELAGRSKKFSETATVADADVLIGALDDPNRFVAAHVILAGILPNVGKVSAKQWLGLNVEAQFRDDGHVYGYDKSDAPRLKKFWQSNLNRHRQEERSGGGTKTGQ